MDEWAIWLGIGATVVWTIGVLFGTSERFHQMLDDRRAQRKSPSRSVHPR